jgi:Putative Ig domain
MAKRSIASWLSRLRTILIVAGLGLALTACGGDQSNAQLSQPISASAPTNAPPVIAGTPSTLIHAGQPYLFQPTASDSEGGTLTFEIENRPQWAAFDVSTGTLQGTPSNSDVGQTANIIISVSDGKTVAELAPFTLTVVAASTQPANTTPTISGAPPSSVVAGQPYNFVPTASDASGDTLSFSISNKPVWANFSATTGQLNGTPGNANVGTFADIKISVTADNSTASLLPFTITVAAASNQPPTISGTPATSVTAGTAYSFQPSASDADDTPLTFSIQNKPSWAVFSPSTGSLSGTPTAAQAGSYADVIISVSDGKATASLLAFTITVSAPAGTPLTISGTPATTVATGAAYSFTPTATHASGTTLTFSIANKPTWEAFSTQTGALTGTPAAGDAATYSNIVISVSDGTHSASLAPFAIMVNPVAASSITLNWSLPTQNTDGSSLSNIAGFKVYYGTAPDALSQVMQFANPGLSSGTITNLAAGAWYFAVTVYTTAGDESAQTNQVTTTIN